MGEYARNLGRRHASPADIQMGPDESRRQGCADSQQMDQGCKSGLFTVNQQSLPKTSRVGIDPTVLPISSYTPLRPAPALVGKPAPPATPTMVPVQANLIDAIWTDRPSRPNNEVFHLADEYTGQSAGDKLQAMQSKLEKIGSPGTVIAQLDEVAWLFNLRGSDIPYNPVSPFWSSDVEAEDRCSLRMPSSHPPLLNSSCIRPLYRQKHDHPLLRTKSRSTSTTTFFRL